ncbi:hypothetical protein BDV98DRAFT_521140 [Pterulicium gracile]|uniref:Uncharacterized protein n=1 Tax=Pterulicium gracile TaxID=1884261 RepID=A0A5C3R0W6_9AGAR|nr:hypothetical protein BDV98DRAFT_521140 [Pterula gracilis]
MSSTPNTQLLAVTLQSSSSLMTNPAELATAHDSLTHVGQVGELSDVQLVSVPSTEWDAVKGDVLGALMGMDGVVRVEVQKAKQRAKRDEL